MIREAVIDTSAIVKALAEQSAQADELVTRLNNMELHAPHLIDAEVGDVLRRKVRHGELNEEIALTGLLALDGLIDARYPHTGPLTRDAWELRDRVRFYDALYVALAARLGLPLLTLDAKLSRAPGLTCKVEVV